MPIIGATTVTSVATTVLSEQISRLLRYAVSRPYLFMGFTFIPEVLVNTDTYKHPIFAAMSGSTAHADSTLVASTALDPQALTVTTAEYAKATFLADRAKRLSTAQLLPVAVNRVVDACMRKIDNDALATATSMTNSTGSAATVNGAQNFNLVLSSFRAQVGSVDQPPTMVMSVSAMRDLGAEALTSGAALFGSVVGQQLHEAVTGPSQGLFRGFGGMRFAESSGVVAGGSGGKVNFISTMGTDCGLVTVFGAPISVEMQREAKTVGEYVVAVHETNSGIVDQDRCFAFTTRD